MWIMALLLPMAVLIFVSLVTLKPKYRKIPVSIAFAPIVPALIGLTLYFLGMAPMQAFMVLVAALSCYYVIRAAAMFGIDASYRTFGKAHPEMKILTFGWILALVLSIFEPLGVATIFVLAYTMDYPVPLNVRGMAEIMMNVNTVLIWGAVLSFGFFMIYTSYRNKILPPPPSKDSALVGNKSRAWKKPPQGRPH